MELGGGLPAGRLSDEHFGVEIERSCRSFIASSWTNTMNVVLLENNKPGGSSFTNQNARTQP